MSTRHPESHEALVASVVAGELDAGDPRVVELARGCERCREALEALATLATDLFDAAAEEREVLAAALRETLRRHRWNISAAARELGVSRPTMYRRMRLLGSEAPI